MRPKLFILLFLIGVSIQQSCIEPYIPENQNDFVPKIVVDGLITDEKEEQTIKLSYTSNIDTLAFEPLSGCFVEVFDDVGNSYSFWEIYPGNYVGSIPSVNLIPNRSFKLHFILNNGEEYESDFQKLHSSPTVDLIHYEIDNKETSDPEISHPGVQFYYDFKAPEDYERYYRLVVEETWEHHATYPISIFYSGGFQKIKPDSSLFFCYQSNTINDIFLISTSGFVKNEFKNYQLHFVDNQTQRLSHKYSFRIKQYSISKEAYEFWLNLEKNNQQNGGLFETQPAIVAGNIKQINFPEKQVLGFFGVSSVSEKRIFITDLQDFPFFHDYNCIASKANIDFWPYTTDPSEWPIYFLNLFDSESGTTVLGIAPPECFDCTKSGGTTHKPYYW